MGPASSTTELLRNGVAWNYGASFTTLLAQLGYTAVTARLLSPRDFGAYATAQTLLGLLSYIALATIAMALIRSAVLDKRTVGTALRLSACFGVSAMCIGLVVAPTWSMLWGSVESERLILLFAPVVLLTSMSAVPLGVLRRQLRFRLAAVIDSSAQLVGFTAGCTIAIITRDPIALVLGQLVAAGSSLLLAGFAARTMLSLEYDGKVARQLIQFASSVSGQNFGYFLIYTLPALVVARVAGVAWLGAYSRANTIVSLPATHLAQGLTKTLYPLYSRQSEKEEPMVWTALSGVTTLVWPLFAILAGASSVVTGALLGEGWGDATTVLPLLALFWAINLAFVVVGNPIEAHRHFADAWRIQVGWLTGVIVASGIALMTSMRIVPFLMVVVAIHGLAHAAQVGVAARHGFIEIPKVIRLYGSRGAYSLAVYVGVVGVVRSLSDDSLLVSGVVTSVIAVSLSVTAIAVIRLHNGRPTLAPASR